MEEAVPTGTAETTEPPFDITNGEQDETCILCSVCTKWIPKDTVDLPESKSPLPGDWRYLFKCSNCNNGSIFFKFHQRSWMDIVQIAIYNLRLRRERELSVEGKKINRDDMFFRFKEDICDFLDKNWSRLCIGKTRTPTWNNTIGSALSSHSDVFKSGYAIYQQHGYWTSRNVTNPTIGKAGTTTRHPRDRQRKKRSASEALGDKGTRKKHKGSSTRRSKASKPKTRKTRQLKPKSVPVLPTKKRYYAPTDKYGQVCIARENSARQVKISVDGLTVENEKGYRMARSSHGVSSGSWFFEIHINDHRGNTRLGWSTEKGDTQAPVGYDEYSFSYRADPPTVFHQSRGRPYGERYGPGDSLGCHIWLPPRDLASISQESRSNEGQESNTFPLTAQEREWAKEKGSSAEAKAEAEEKTNILSGSCIRFFKNGKDLGPAFVDIPEGIYYPAASLYMSASVIFNFGPTFKYPPELNTEYRPFSEMAEEERKRQEFLRAEKEMKEKEQKRKEEQMQALLAASGAAEQKTDTLRDPVDEPKNTNAIENSGGEEEDEDSDSSDSEEFTDESESSASEESVSAGLTEEGGSGLFDSSASNVAEIPAPVVRPSPSTQSAFAQPPPLEPSTQAPGGGAANSNSGGFFRLFD